MTWTFALLHGPIIVIEFGESGLTGIGSWVSILFLFLHILCENELILIEWNTVEVWLAWGFGEIYPLSEPKMIH